MSKLKFIKSIVENTHQQQEILQHHYPCMYREVLERVQNHFNKSESLFQNMCDCTIGTGGHAKLLLEKMPVLQILGIDIDERMVQKLKHERLMVKQDNFVNFNKYNPIKGAQFDVVFADLGYNINQIYTQEYGLSYRSGEQNILDMRYSRTISRSAKDILNQASQQELKEILEQYGDLYHSNQIARLLIKQRNQQKYENVDDLVKMLQKENLSSQIPQIFQALRIAVNNEIGNLRGFLNNLLKQKLIHEQLVLIITFHSIEANEVQKFIHQNRRALKGVHQTKASENEVEENPRSRSAKLYEMVLRNLQK